MPRHRRPPHTATPHRRTRRGARPPLAVAAVSLGCPKNLVDTEVMLGLLRGDGFSITADARDADVLLVNTCCFIEDARAEAAEALEEAAAWRRSHRAGALICAGCWPQMDAGLLHRRFPEIDACLGPGDVGRVVSVVRDALAGHKAYAPRAAPSAYLYDESAPRLRATPPWTAYIKIADGCSHRCRFCVIPRLRGRFRSRSVRAIVREAERLAEEGVREVNLVAQDTTAFGHDHREGDIADLLRDLAHVEGLRWVRLLYGFPTRVTGRLIAVMAAEPRICDYIDIPFQHSHPDVLRSMGRPGEGESYLRLVHRLRDAMPDIAIRSTFLVGFPGETEAHFRDLLQFLQAAQLDRAGAFCYSRERGTPAADLPHQVPAEVAQARYDELMTLQQSISLARNEPWVGRELEVLLEQRGAASGRWIGRSFRDAPEIDGSVEVRAGRRNLRPGRFVRAAITAAEPYDLTGEIAEPTGPAPRSRGRDMRR